MEKKSKSVIKKEKFTDLLKELELSSKAIKIYNTCYGYDVLSLNEIITIAGLKIETEIQQALTELIDNNLLIKIESDSPEIIPHYAILSPLSIIKKGLIKIKEKFAKPDENLTQLVNQVVKESFDNEGRVEIDSLVKKFNNFKAELESDLAKVKEELSELGENLDEQVDSSTSFLDKYQDSLVNAFRAQMTGILIVLLQFKADFEDNLKAVGISNEQWISIRDIVKDLLAKEIHDKTQELSDMISEDFNDIKNEFKEMVSKKFKDRFEQQAVYVGMLNIFITEMKKFDDIITKKNEEFHSGLKKVVDIISQKTTDSLRDEYKADSEQLKKIQEVLDTTLEEQTKGDRGSDKFWPLNNKAIIQEELSTLLKQCKKELIIIVPELEDYIPFEDLDLNFVEDKKGKLIGKTRKISAEDIGAEEGPSEKELIKQLKSSLTSIKKTAFEKKGFEISHDIAEIMSVVSDINPNSVIIEGMKNWLNRLLVIRKVLDQNLRLILLQDIEKWENDYASSKQEEMEEEPSENKEEIQKPKEEEGLKIRICSSTKHNDKYARALRNTPNMEYKKIKKNTLIAIKADDLLVIFGIILEHPDDPNKNIIGFFTNDEYFIQIIETIINDKWEHAHYAKTIRISNAINEILDNINEFDGIEIGAILQNVLDVAFKKTGGLSLGVLEIKVLINKLKSIDQPLDKELKSKVIEKIQQVNDDLKLAEKIIAPKLTEPHEKEKIIDTEISVVEEPIEELPADFELEIDKDRINALFDIFLDKINDLNGSQLSEQIQKINDLVLQVQGFSDIVKWKEDLLKIEEKLIEPVKEKLKEDIKKYKMGILSLQKEKEKSLELQASINEKIIEPMAQDGYEGEEYISPGLSQSSYGPETSTLAPPTRDSEKLDDLFKDIHDSVEKDIGPEISKTLQDIMDLILETVGYSMDLKDMKDWITKLRGIRKKLNQDTKNQFLTSFNKWRAKYASEEEEEKESEFSTTLSIETPSNEEKPQEGNKLKFLFEKIIEDSKTSNGNELTDDLQEIADILLIEHGAVSVRDIRPWISKLRSLREPLEDEVKSELLDDLNIWKEKFL